MMLQNFNLKWISILLLVYVRRKFQDGSMHMVFYIHVSISHNFGLKEGGKNVISSG